MALPLVAIYYGLLIIGSILFLQVYDQQQFIDGKQKIVETISQQTENIMSKVTPYMENISEKIQEQLHLENPVEVADSAIEAVKQNEIVKKACGSITNICDSVKETIVGEYITKVWLFIQTFIKDHPIICKFSCKTSELIHKYAEVIYNFSAEKINFVAEQEPIKSYINNYSKVHDEYVTPYVESASDLVSTYFNNTIKFVSEKIGAENTNSSSELTYTFFIIIVAVFICKLTLTKILKLFVKDAFQMHKNVSDMYNEALKSTTHSPIYETIKEKSEHAMIVDELEEVEEADASKSDDSSRASSAGSNRNIPGSNRSTAGSNRRQEESKEGEQQEEGEQQKKELDVDDTVVQRSNSPVSARSRGSTRSIGSIGSISSVPAPVQPPRTARTTTETASVTVTGSTV